MKQRAETWLSNVIDGRIDKADCSAILASWVKDASHRETGQAPDAAAMRRPETKIQAKNSPLAPTTPEWLRSGRQCRCHKSP